jgi:hypothetical protein
LGTGQRGRRRRTRKMRRRRTTTTTTTRRGGATCVCMRFLKSGVMSASTSAPDCSPSFAAQTDASATCTRAG